MLMFLALRAPAFPVRFAAVLLSGVAALSLAQSADPGPGETAPTDAQVVVTRDIPYLGTERTERADLYLPTGHDARAAIPAVLVIHGGGWAGGDKAGSREINLCTTLARHGYAALSLNYHLGPKEHPAAAWPQNIRDCRAAVRWLCANAGRLGLDATRLGVIGGSAGGHLAAVLGVTEGGSALDDADAPAGDVSGGIRAVVALYAPIQLGLGPLGPDTNRATSPLTYLDQHDPPFLLIHGTADTAVSPERSREFAAALAKAGIEHELVVVDGASHSFDLQPPQRDLRPLVLAFFARHLKR